MPAFATCPKLFTRKIVVISLDKRCGTPAHSQQVADVLSGVTSRRTLLRESEIEFALLAQPVEATSGQLKVGRAGRVADNDKLNAPLETPFGQHAQGGIRRRN